MPRWTGETWRAGALGWIDEQLERIGARRTGGIEQPHVRPWSTALRVPTNEGDLWFKASIPVLSHDAAVVSLLAARRPDVVPVLLAVDPECGWMLTRDCGEQLRGVIERERDLGRWLDVLPRYAELQIDAAPDLERYLSAGVPDRRLASLPPQYDELLGRVDGLTGEELDRLQALEPRVAELCERLAALGVPETIQHDDLHDGQVYVRDDTYVFFDWGDSCVSHPFFSMSVTLEGQIAWGLEDVEGSVDLRPYRDAYLEPFTAFASRRELEAALDAALRCGWACRALTVEMYASELDPPDRDEQLAGVGRRLQMLAAGFA
jgi:hypothetical protein